jgi:hypothetical protein
LLVAMLVGSAALAGCSSDPQQEPAADRREATPSSADAEPGPAGDVATAAERREAVAATEPAETIAEPRGDERDAARSRERSARDEAERARTAAPHRRFNLDWRVLNDVGDDLGNTPLPPSYSPPAVWTPPPEPPAQEGGDGAASLPAPVSAPPVIVDVWPAQGPASGGQEVVIRGENLRAVQVLFGVAPARILAATAESLTVRSPPVGAAGPAPIVVTNGDGSYAIAPFTYYR